MDYYTVLKQLYDVIAIFLLHMIWSNNSNITYQFWPYMVTQKYVVMMTLIMWFMNILRLIESSYLPCQQNLFQMQSDSTYFRNFPVGDMDQAP